MYIDTHTLNIYHYFVFDFSRYILIHQIFEENTFGFEDAAQSLRLNFTTPDSTSIFLSPLLNVARFAISLINIVFQD